MDKFEWVKKQLERRKGQWPIVVRETGLTSRTFHNILNKPKYAPNMATVEKLHKFLLENMRFKELK